MKLARADTPLPPIPEKKIFAIMDFYCKTNAYKEQKGNEFVGLIKAE
jgi:hypothetical protein